VKLELAAATADADAAEQLARTVGGTLYADRRESTRNLPFRALVTGVSDDLDTFGDVADVGLYLICRRLIKPGPPTVVGLFPMRHHPEKSHAACDAHWRDEHAPLALEHHAHMSHYTQLSVVHVLKGEPFDGFALCAFNTEEDLRERFFTTPESVEIIQNDVAKFADTQRSGRRLIATTQSFE
jgi:uncharacterized protein (TIGR02118 family)